MKPIKVLLAEDHTLVRAGFRALLQHIADIEIIAEAGDGHEALRLIETHLPDVVLMDISMPGLNGLEVTARVSKRFPTVRVIMLSMHANEEYVLRALRAGAVGYLLKDADTTELELAIKAAMRNETYLSPPISQQVIKGYLRRVGETPTPFERLTPRQREVLQLIAEGHTTQDIAQILGISVKTVETHRAQLMERLNIYDVAGLVRYAVRIGLVTVD
ncbi:MAG: response regulator transcription factor [Anaerolineae bacterium]|nr:response regulator transcription factor [Anaerolineae bacterium]